MDNRSTIWWSNFNNFCKIPLTIIFIIFIILYFFITLKKVKSNYFKVHIKQSIIIFSFFEIYNVNYKGEVGTVYLCFRSKSNSDFFCLSQLSLPRPILSLYINSWVPSETWGQNQLWSFKLWDTKLDRVLATNEQVQKKTFRSVEMQYEMQD